MTILLSRITVQCQGWLLWPDQRSSERSQQSLLTLLPSNFKTLLFEMQENINIIIWFSKGEETSRDYMYQI